MPPRKRRKKKVALPPAGTIQIPCKFKVGDEVEFLKPAHFDSNGFTKGSKGVISKIKECEYATGGWMIWIKGTPQTGSGYSIFYFIDKEFSSAWTRDA